LLGFCVLLVIAGHETTTKMGSNGIEILSRHPDQRDELVADPGLTPGAVEECCCLPQLDAVQCTGP
jgi:cytochrome P450